MRLRVFLSDHELSSFELQTGREYVAGRSSTADILLDHPKGISREHLRFVEIGGHWHVQLTAKYGKIVCQDRECKDLELRPGMEFSSPPFRFLFEDLRLAPPIEPSLSDDGSRTIPLGADKTEALAPTTEGAVSMSADPADVSHSVSIDAGTASGTGETTNTGLSHLVAQLRATYSTGEKETFTLEGNVWLAGRVPDCEIYLRDHHISRNHFEIVKRNDQYLIEDQGSSNGTRLNGKKLKPNHPVELNSGDLIEIMSVKISFEIRDEDFEHKIQHIPDQNFALPVPVPAAPHGAYGHGALVPINLPALPGPSHGSVQRIDEIPATPLSKLKSFVFANKLRAGIVGVAIVLLIGYLLSPGGDKKRDMASTGKNPGSPTLTDEQKRMLQNSLRLAKAHYTEGKFSNCISEIEKIEAIVPVYEDAKVIKNYCEVGLQNQILVQQEQALEQQRRENERRVREIVEICDAKRSRFRTVDEAAACLMEARDLQPDHPKIAEILGELEARMAREEAERQRRQADANLRRECMDAYNRMSRNFNAKESFKEKIGVARTFLGRNCPDIESINQRANRMLASAERGRRDYFSSAARQIQSMAASSRYREAVIECGRLLKEENPLPDNVRDECRASEKSLNDKLRANYENANIEESFGNVDEAVVRWSKICKDDVPSGEYCKKARSKLRNYGK